MKINLEFFPHNQMSTVYFIKIKIYQNKQGISFTA